MGKVGPLAIYGGREGVREGEGEGGREGGSERGGGRGREGVREGEGEGGGGRETHSCVMDYFNPVALPIIPRAFQRKKRT